MKSILLYRQNFSVFSVSFLLSFHFVLSFLWTLKSFFSNGYDSKEVLLHSHCVKNDHTRSFFWSVFSCILADEYRKICKTLRIWTLFTQWVRYFNEVKQILAKYHNLTVVIPKLLERKLHEGLAEHDIVVNYFCFSLSKVLLRIHAPYMYLYV